MKLVIMSFVFVICSSAFAKDRFLIKRDCEVKAGAQFLSTARNANSAKLAFSESDKIIRNLEILIQYGSEGDEFERSVRQGYFEKTAEAGKELKAAASYIACINEELDKIE